MNDFDPTKVNSFASKRNASPPYSKKPDEEAKISEEKIISNNVVGVSDIIKVPRRKRTQNAVGHSNKRPKVESITLLTA